MNTYDLNAVRQDAIRFLQTMRVPGVFDFRFSPSSEPNLIGSSLAAMMAGLTGWVDTLRSEEKRKWSDRINGCQRDDGWFEDDDIAEANLRPGYARERALLHRTRHALMALRVLNAVPVKPLRMVETWLGAGRMTAWCETLNLADYWYSSNMLMDAAVLLLEADTQRHRPELQDAVDRLLDFCDAHLNPETGYHDAGLSETRNAMAGAMHLYPVYVIRSRMIEYASRAIETTLRLQQPDGLFGYESGTGGEDCLDYDAVSILCNLGFLCPEYRQTINQCFQEVSHGLAECRNPDGGFSAHRRKETYYFGTHTTPVHPGESSVWATYSRVLTCVMIEGFQTNAEPAGWHTGHNMMEVWDGGFGLMGCVPRGWKARQRQFPLRSDSRANRRRVDPSERTESE